MNREEQLKQAIELHYPSTSKFAPDIVKLRSENRVIGMYEALQDPHILRHADPEIMKQAGWVREEEMIGINDREDKPIKEGDILLVRDNGAWGVVVWKAPFYEVTIDEHQSSLYSREFLQQSLIMGNIKTHKLPTSDLIQFKSVCGNLYCQDMLINGVNSVCCGRATKMIPTPLEPIQQPPKNPNQRTCEDCGSTWISTGERCPECNPLG